MIDPISRQQMILEQEVLGSALCGHTELKEVVRPWRLQDLGHRIIWNAICPLDKIDIVTVAERLKELGVLELVGGRQYLTDLAMSIAVPLSAQGYSERASKCLK